MTSALLHVYCPVSLSEFFFQYSLLKQTFQHVGSHFWSCALLKVTFEIMEDNLAGRERSLLANDVGRCWRSFAKKFLLPVFCLCIYICFEEIHSTRRLKLTFAVNCSDTLWCNVRMLFVKWIHLQVKDWWACYLNLTLNYFPVAVDEFSFCLMCQR